MPKCPVCNDKVSILGDLVLMRRKFLCKKCGSMLKVNPRSVTSINILGVLVSALLGFVVGIAQNKLIFAIILLVWILIFIFLYINFAKLVLAEDGIPPK